MSGGFPMFEPKQPHSPRKDGLRNHKDRVIKLPSFSTAPQLIMDRNSIGRYSILNSDALDRILAAPFSLKKGRSQIPIVNQETIIQLRFRLDDIVNGSVSASLSAAETRRNLLSLRAKSEKLEVLTTWLKNSLQEFDFTLSDLRPVSSSIFE
jgi:hypothetical protein